MFDNFVNKVNNIYKERMSEMESNMKMFHATKYVGATVLIIGIAIFLYGAFVSEYSTMIGIGIGTVMGAVFTFLIGMFLVVSEEMIANSRKCKKESA